MNAVTNAAVTAVPITSIVIGIRRRSALGRLQSLQRSISEHGLIHPILVRNGHELVAGHRRLEACRRLGWTKIPARHVDRMTDDDLRAIEVEENREREALNDYDTSKARLAEIRQAEADLKKQAEAELSATSARNSKRGRKGEGRPRKADSERAVAEATGIPETTQRRIEQHVAIAEAYPFMQRRGWVQHSVLEAGAELEKLPATERPKVAALLDQAAIPPKTAIGMIKNVATMPVAARRELFDLAKSGDAQERQTALTRAAAVPPPVDPGLTLLGDATDALHKATKACRVSEFKPEIDALSTQARQVFDRFQKWNAHARR